MWPKLLDLTQDECRGALRRLELESYSNVVGAFRAQGILNENKLKILKDLRQAFHISDERHKAEIRRVVNDESLSTIAKMTSGPNSEIEWNREGSRGFMLINRKPSQTALSVVADRASEFGATLNKHLKHPADTRRDHILDRDNDVNTANKIVTSDPYIVQPKVKNKQEKSDKSVVNSPEKSNAVESGTSKKKEPIKYHSPPTESPALKTAPTPTTAAPTTTTPTENKSPNDGISMPKPITSSRRRKSTTSLASIGSPPQKAILITNRRETMTETSSRFREPLEPISRPPPAPIVATSGISTNIQHQIQLPSQHHHQPTATPSLPMKSAPKPTIISEVRIVPKEKPDRRESIKESIIQQTPFYTSTQSPISVHRTLPSNEADVQVIEAIVPSNVETIKGTRNVMDAISKGAQLVKVIESKVVKQPISINAQTQSTPKASAVGQTYVPVKVSASKTHKFQVIGTDAPSTAVATVTIPTPQIVSNLNVIQHQKQQQQLQQQQQQLQQQQQQQRTVPTVTNHKNDIISIPTARNPNIVKTSDKTIMHVTSSSHLSTQQKPHIKKSINIVQGQNHSNAPLKYPPKHILQMLQSPSNPRPVSIYPKTTILKAVPAQVSTLNETQPQEYVYEEEINDWQHFDPTRIDQSNGYVKIVRNVSENNGRAHDHQKHVTNVIGENIIYDEDIITEEYITTEEYEDGDNVIELAEEDVEDGVVMVAGNVRAS